MSSSEITRKRLNSLKMLTEELKDHTKNAPLDLSHIKQLLSNTRQLHTSRAHRPPAPDNGAQLDDFIGSDSSFRPLFPDKKDLSKGFSELQQEVVQLREENVGLEQKILNLREEISSLEEEKSKLALTQQSTNTQYFKLSESLDGFIGRLNIPAASYDRLEYSVYDIQLKLDKLILIKKEKSSIQEFQLTCLRQAEYCSETVVVLRFEEFFDEEHKNLTNVFLKFYSEEHLHKWDLALFSNYHIVNSISEKRLFEKYFRCLKVEKETNEQNQRIKNIRESEELDQNKEKDLLKLLIQKREEYLEVKKLINLKLQHKIKSNVALNNEELELMETKNQQISEPQKKFEKQEVQKPPPITSSPIEKIDELEPNQEQSQDIVEPLSLQKNQHPIHIKHTQSNMVDYRDSNNINQFINHDSRISKATNMSAEKIPTNPMQGTFPLSSPPLMPGQINQSHLRQSKTSIVNQLSNFDGRTRSYESSSRNNSISKFKEISQQKLNNAKIKLQSGYYATKYSKDGFSPHQKKVFLSLDCRKLCWSERDKQSQYKSVPIAVLIRVDYGVLGEGITKHVKNPDSRYFCVIEYYTNEYKKKTIELGSGNMQDIIDFSSQLTSIIQNRQVLPN